MSEELKECPFCGGEASLRWEQFYSMDASKWVRLYNVKCKICGARSKSIFSDARLFDETHSERWDEWDNPSAHQAEYLWNCRKEV